MENALKQRLGDANPEVRIACMGALAENLDEIDRELVGGDLYAVGPRFDPAERVEEERIEKAAQQLNLPPEEVRDRYESLADRFGLTLSWR